MNINKDSSHLPIATEHKTRRLKSYEGPFRFECWKRTCNMSGPIASYLCPLPNVSRHHSHTSPTPTDSFPEQLQRAPQELRCHSPDRILMLHSTAAPPHTHGHAHRHAHRREPFRRKVCSQRVRWIVCKVFKHKTDRPINAPNRCSAQTGINMIWGWQRSTAVLFSP